MRATLFAGALAVALSTPSLATTWVEVERSDPFAPGAACQAHEPASYGTYIYQWPSRYDVVFWPYTDPNWIWGCPESGFVAFGSDFDRITDAERPRIAALLAERRAADAGAFGEGGRLAALEAIYRVRDDIDWAWLNRVFAQLRVGEPARADAYRAAATPLLEAELVDAEGVPRIERLYLLGAYALRHGDADASAAYFAEARSVAWTDEDGEDHVGLPYFDEMIDEVAAGRLDELWGPASAP